MMPHPRPFCDIAAVPAADTACLRQMILRPDLALHACCNSYDDMEGALHLAAFDRKTRGMVGVGSIMPDPSKDEALASACVFWIVHAMAVRPDYRRFGIGSTLLRSLMRYAAKRSTPAGIRLDSLPCAIGFYRKNGFVPETSRSDDQPVPMQLSAREFHHFFHLK